MTHLFNKPFDVILEENRHIVSFNQESKNYKEIQSHLEKIMVFKKIGRGEFGVVYLVKHYSHPEFLALKCINKAKITKMQMESYLAVIFLYNLFSKKNIFLNFSITRLL